MKEGRPLIKGLMAHCTLDEREDLAILDKRIGPATLDKRVFQLLGLAKRLFGSCQKTFWVLPKDFLGFAKRSM